MEMDETARPMTFDLYIWKSPRDLDGEAAEALVASWQAAGGDPATSPFEPSPTSAGSTANS